MKCQPPGHQVALLAGFSSAGVADEKLALSGAEQVHERRRITACQQFLERLEPDRIGGIESQFARLEWRRLEDLRESLVEPQRERPPTGHDEPTSGIRMPCFMGEPGCECAAGVGDMRRVVAAGGDHLGEHLVAFSLPATAGRVDDLGSFAG